MKYIFLADVKNINIVVVNKKYQEKDIDIFKII